VEIVLTMGRGVETPEAGIVTTEVVLIPFALVVETVLTMAECMLPIGMILRSSAAEDGWGAAGADANGATHLVQIVEIEVRVIVEMVVVTCLVGVPKKGVIIVVNGLVDRAVKILV